MSNKILKGLKKERLLMLLEPHSVGFFSVFPTVESKSFNSLHPEAGLRLFCRLSREMVET